LQNICKYGMNALSLIYQLVKRYYKQLKINIMTTQIFATFTDFAKRADQTTNGVSPEFAASNPNYSKVNATNVDCWNADKGGFDGAWFF